MSLRQSVSKVKTGELRSEDLCTKALESIQALNPQLNSILEISSNAVEKAKALDKNPHGRLAGVPVIVKDNFCVKGTKTTAASKILGNFVAPYTAHCIDRLEQEGAIVIAKANLDEFAMGSSNENSSFGACKNPWDLSRVPGGSSGGSAASVAAGLAPIAIGSDTGGSIRQPASFCGVVGIKPTYGSISRYGMIAFASSLDQAGPMAKTVDDAALALEIMISKDPRDSTNVETSLDFTESPKTSYRIGVPRQYQNIELSDDIRKNWNDTLDDLKAQGHQVVEVDLPHSEYAIPVYYLVSACEASSNLSRYDGVRYGLRDTKMESGQEVKQLKDFYKLTRTRGFGDEVKRRILLGTFALSAGYYDAFYRKACQVRRLIANDYVEAFKNCDVILTPVSTSTAFQIGEKINDPLEMYANDLLTTPVSLAGLPSMSLPSGLDTKGMPMGLQVIAPAFQDAQMIGFAKTLETTLGFNETPKTYAGGLS